MSDRPIVEATNVRTRLGGRWVHDGVSFALRRGEITALIGGSGTGKTVLLRELVGLERPTEGRVSLFGEDLASISGQRLNALRRRFGLLFQDGALFSAMSVAENVAAPVVEHLSLPDDLLCEVVNLKLNLVGLPLDAARRRPSELSGGMRKRAALARALALEPELLFLDEPTSGLDPLGAREFDHTLRVLVDSLGLTVLLTTHDLDTLYDLVDRVIVLHEGKVIGDGPLKEVARSQHEWIRSYFDTRMTG
ncbi:MAG: ATP-binding cassette domain-containing protein [Thiobacillaceae bacterium]|nr:ATP-binding cassette domain-containing protein [Thiobacillaceae bacterium]